MTIMFAGPAPGAAFTLLRHFWQEMEGLLYFLPVLLAVVSL
jgi:hypothetical protein